MTTTHILGYPRIGPKRELKFALEAFWQGRKTAAELQSTAAALRSSQWRAQRDAGMRFVSVGDFALYDHMLDTAALLGALPARFGFDAPTLSLQQSFELSRGNAAQPAMEMTKWFDTNYHYLVPELDAQTSFERGTQNLLDRVREALAAGYKPKPVLVGPLTFLWLSKSHQSEFDRLSLAPALSAAYARVLAQLAELGVEWVQLDEPALTLELDTPWRDALPVLYGAIPAQHGAARPRLLLTTYFASVTLAPATLATLPVDGVHLDLVRAPEQIATWRDALPPQWVLSAGIIDGRNVWRTDLAAALQSLRPLQAALGERLWIAPSCSLLHVPVSLGAEDGADARLNPEVRPWLAFAEEKLAELATLATALDQGEAAVAAALQANATALAARRACPRVTLPQVRRRVQSLTEADARRASPYPARSAVQRERLHLPVLPTTTIGSFPQTADIRAARAAWRRGELRHTDYLQKMRDEIAAVIHKQEVIGLDVLVHGEPERNDMVEFFGEQLWGYTFSAHGWVQSYGSRCVKPPIIWGDVWRPEPMTVDTARYAQSLSAKPVKGMLTGPITLLQWSFVRDDLPRDEVALQLALAVRDEVNDLQNADISIIQIDEPALREGLPLQRSAWAAYLGWAVRAFGVAAGVARDHTQIHTHMCYSEFNDILPSIAALDADVITIETARSNMALLDGFGAFAYPNEIGPGVYDIHSPRVPTADDMARLLRRAAQLIPPERLWVNPDCGLKTRAWPETESALRHMVRAASELREELRVQGHITPPAVQDLTQPRPRSTCCATDCA
ncbi:5-methyltetrahydropteroyltriglutamate--homocysteine S-methyltransferase [Thiomonas bhubaneswarensis]|uniref:5-methyltetrahydropteroyltriglutamate--homocysteine methyltransferase n=1 Tax=Thiomonas bhubaneswarensis TaxID=339866 RepID=A0A0K6I7N4_9BURK|nr:5-methyltetrahydropteroyltriglutamate--homocysteine S-methyltransferase [Thiomonas bhubaneswarensis]CUA99337.1 methionine synthase (B12-independent) [Thiomonas bhubaneswarensis]